MQLFLIILTLITFLWSNYCRTDKKIFWGISGKAVIATVILHVVLFMAINLYFGNYPKDYGLGDFLKGIGNIIRIEFDVMSFMFYFFVFKTFCRRQKNVSSII